MAKVISQETFDDVVKENIQEFDMTVQEAVDDAVAQFESQGVNLNNIVRDPAIYVSGNDESTVHPVITAIQKLDLSLESDNADITADLQAINSECLVDLAHRCMAGKNKAYPTLMKALKKYKNDPVKLLCVLNTLSSLCNGQPDLLTEEGCDLLIELLQEYSHDCNILECTVTIIKYTCIKHEANRQLYVEKKLITHLMSILEKHNKQFSLVKEVCNALRVLTFDDDVRVPFGKAHDHAKMIVEQGKGLKVVLDLCKEFVDQPTAMAELLSLLSTIIVRHEYCKEVMELGGLPLILLTLEKHLNDKNLCKQILGVLKNLSGNDEVKEAIVKAGGIDLTIASVTKHQANPRIAEAGCRALATYALRIPANSEKIIEKGGHTIILQAMSIHRNDSVVQIQACMAIRNIVSRKREFCNAFLEGGAEELIHRAMSNFKECTDEGKAALRDLECNVELRELWKGEGVGVHS